MGSRRMGVFAVVTAALATCAFTASLAATPARAYPPDQLARGENVWTNVCADCHGPNSTDPDAPLLLHPGTLTGYANAAEVFQYAREKMPNDDPGSLPEQDYWDVVAYILAQQGIERDVALGPDTAGDVPTTP